MYRSIKALGVAAGLGVSVISTAALATDETGDASAQIQQAITIVEDTSMDFGNIAVDGTAQTVTLSAAGVVAGGGGVYDFSGSPTNAQFTVSGDASTAVTISFSTGDQLTGPGTAMDLDTFVHDAGGSPAIGGGGTLVLGVGASLDVNGPQTSGAYTGTYTLTVNY